MDNKEYNGYTNYATWRINLEILDGIGWHDYDYEGYISTDVIQDMVEEIVFGNSVEKDCLAASYARAFLEDVNYQEISDHINHERSCAAE